VHNVREAHLLHRPRPEQALNRPLHRRIFVEHPQPRHRRQQLGVARQPAAGPCGLQVGEHAAVEGRVDRYRLHNVETALAERAHLLPWLSDYMKRS
jgi:hypothetical protein